MPLLAEINLGSALPWGDDVTHTWLNDPEHTWFDGSGYALCSMVGFADERYWDAYITDFTPPRYQSATNYGGYCAMTFGSISFSLDLFAGTGRWPPPPSFQLKIWYTIALESLMREMFVGSVHLSSLNFETAEYNLYAAEYDKDLLEESYAYSDYAEEYGYVDDDLAPIPRAFGEVLHVSPMRTSNDGSTRPTFFKSGISGTLAKAITGSANNGSGKVRFTTGAAHGFTNGATITVEVDDFASTYNATAVATVINATTFDFATIAYVDDQAGHAFQDGWWRAYDDGVPISSNVLDNGDGTFSLTSTLVGAITISGTGTETTLEDLFSWACELERLNLTYENSYGRSPSPVINYWASSQLVLVDFLSEVSQFFTHLFYITKDSLFLVDVMVDHGDRTLDDSDFLPSSYAQGDPISQYKATWTVMERKEDRTGKRMKETESEYILTGSYVYGEIMNITPYSTDKDVIIQALANIKTKLQSATANIKIPLMGAMRSVSWKDTDQIWKQHGEDAWMSEEEAYPPPLPGERLWGIDTKLKQDLYFGMTAMGVQYDFKNEVVVIDGVGSFALTRDNVT